MIEFIIGEDDHLLGTKIETAISNVMVNESFPFQIKYISTKEEIQELFNDKILKIYILDVKHKESSALEIAREIRKEDYDSMIIIINNTNTGKMEQYEAPLMIYDYISLYDDYEQKLTDSLKNIISKKWKHQNLTITEYNYLYKIPFQSILYITTDIINRKTIVVTEKEEYSCTLSLYKIESQLDHRFLKIHRSYIVNIDKITSIDFKNNNLFLKNKTNPVYISRRYHTIVQQKLIRDCKNNKKDI